ncbi:MAG: hypothetical protein EPN93_09355 [Spirochaetes bacterium]|nr:MAG: hypothetical protein EPN93_09355 [Spirochaetota bacterium]
MKNARFALIALFVVSSCFTRPGEDGIRSALGFHHSPEQVIKTLESADKSSREHFMLAVAYGKKDNRKKALFHFANSCFSSHYDLNLKLFPGPVYSFVTGFRFKSDYYNDAVAEIAEIFFNFREFEYSVKFADLVRKDDPGLYRDAILLKSRALSELNRHEDAMKTLADLADDLDDPGSRSLIKVRTASLYEKKSETAEALKAYLDALKIKDSGWQSGIAVKNSLKIAEKSGEAFSAEDALLLGKAAFNNALFSESADMLKKALTELKEESARADAVHFLIRAYVKGTKIPEADSAVQQYRGAKLPESDLQKTKANELWNSRNKTAAVAVYQGLVDKLTGAAHQEVLKRLAQHMAEKQPAGFEKYIIEYKTKYSEDPQCDFLLWMLGKSAMKRKDQAAATAYFEEGAAKYPQGIYTDNMRFWLYKIYEGAGKKAEKDKKFRELVVIHPDSAYTWTLMHRKQGEFSADSLSADFKAGLQQDDREAYLFAHTMLVILQKDFAERDRRAKSLPSRDLAEYTKLEKSVEKLTLSSSYKNQLLRLKKYFEAGYSDGITRELNMIPDDKEAQYDKNVVLAHFGSRYAHPYHGIFSTLELMKHHGISESFALMPLSTLRRICPVDFLECIDKTAGEFKIDRNMILAVIKAESLFNPRAVSPAGAEGLMQLMPATAKGVARELKMQEYELKDPCTSIRFGTHHLAWLDKMFKGNFDYMVSGYNAGSGNVRVWQRDISTEDADYFAEFIPFQETRYYIFNTRKFLYQYLIINK